MISERWSSPEAELQIIQVDQKHGAGSRNGSFAVMPLKIPCSAANFPCFGG
jgi:hypothetical protein